MKLSRRARNGLMVGTAALLLASCSSLNYYRQAAQGQLTLLSDARPIDDWLGDQATDTKLRVRLATARQIRTFAVKELGLPDNNSYKNYAALTRPFVLWNVVAAPELSLNPIQWCFPVAGCVSYRGYYSKDDAMDYARELRAEGNDVSVGGVPAYSTLGWFNDPLLSTFIHYPDAELARLIFHELSHQVVYVAGDSQFNESFASTVEEAGVERWLSGYGNETMRDNYLKISARKKQFLALLLGCRDALATSYASKISIAEKRAGPRSACSSSCRMTTSCSRPAGAATPATTVSSPNPCPTPIWPRSPPTTISFPPSARCWPAKRRFPVSTPPPKPWRNSIVTSATAA